MTTIRILLALASTVLFNMFVTGCSAPDDDDTAVTADDDTVIGDDDSVIGDDDDTGTAVFTVDPSLPPVEVILIPTSGERSSWTCSTMCELTQIEVGTYMATANLEGALFVPTQIVITADHVTAHTFVGGWAPQGTYRKYDNPEGTGSPLNGTTYEITTTVEAVPDLWGSQIVVHLRIPGIGDYMVDDGDTVFLDNSTEVGAISSDRSWIKASPNNWWLVRQ